MPATVLMSVLAHGGRAARYGEFIIVTMHTGAFVTTPVEYHQHQNWARGRASTGNPVRDRTLFVDRFDTVIGREGSGVATKGHPMALLRIVKAMKANAIFMEGWNVPRNLGDSVEMKKRKPTVAAAPPAAAPVAGEPPAAVVTPAASATTVAPEPAAVVPEIPKPSTP